MKDKDTYAQTLATWDKVADRYQKTFMDLTLYNDSYDTFFIGYPNRNLRFWKLVVVLETSQNTF